MAIERVVEELATRIPGQEVDLEELDVPQIYPTSLSRHTVEIFEPSGRVIATTRTTIERPSEEILTDPVPLLWVPGYGGIKPAYRHAREGSAQPQEGAAGRIAVTWRPVRDMSLLDTLKPANIRHPELLPRRTLQSVINYVCNDTESEQVDLACHSMGGFIAALATVKDAEKIRNLVLVASAGLEDHSLLTLARRSVPFIKGEFLPHFHTLREENEARMALEALHYFLRNPARTFAEGIAVANCNIRNDIERARDLGVMIGGLLFAADELFIEENVREQAGHLFHILDTFDMDDVGHMGPQLHGLAVARAVVGITTRLNLAQQILPPLKIVS
ncbi:alpha/beta hydrolase [Candidatus Nomurabacteria bacterium]|nr:alpha/beta hydrolase [Candidatus Nomurabacteria bacterium]